MSTQVKVTGTIEFRDVELGAWVLKTDDGRSLLIAGGDRKIKKDGARIEAEGQLDESALTAQMVGPRFIISSYRFL